MTGAKVVTQHELSRRRDPRFAPRGDLVSIATAAALEVGERVRFNGEAQARWTVRAKGGRFVILTKPYNLPHPREARQSYTVIDLYHGICGAHDSYGHGVEDAAGLARTLAALEADEVEVSVRNNVTLDIADVKAPK
jgi:hypothetical protein